MSKTEPYHRREWETKTGRLLTCGRPGRASYGTKWQKIPDETIEAWAAGLPGGPLALVSLLGWKKDTGNSEFWYYPFRSAEEVDHTRPSMQEWLSAKWPGRFNVYEFRTHDYQDIDPTVLRRVVTCVRTLLDAGETVVLVDSGGKDRTGAVRVALGYTNEKTTR